MSSRSGLIWVVFLALFLLASPCLTLLSVGSFLRLASLGRGGGCQLPPMKDEGPVLHSARVTLGELNPEPDT